MSEDTVTYLLIVIWVAMLILIVGLANSKGLSGVKWLIYGLLVWPVALAHILVLPKTPEKLKQEVIERDMIHRAAYNESAASKLMKCPHCNKNFEASSTT